VAYVSGSLLSFAATLHTELTNVQCECRNLCVNSKKLHGQQHFMSW